jgi:hypothetical protein
MNLRYYDVPKNNPHVSKSYYIFPPRRDDYSVKRYNILVYIQRQSLKVTVSFYIKVTLQIQQLISG